MPISLKLRVAKGKPVRRGLDHYWSIIQDYAAIDATFTSQDIVLKSSAERSDILDFLRRLLKACIIEVVEIPDGKTPIYKALLRQSAAPKVRADGSVIAHASKQQCMWNTMRNPIGRLGFTHVELAHWSSVQGAKISPATARSYLWLLFTAGYLIEVRSGKAGSLAVWRLDPAMNTGPLPPMILRTKAVFDQNRHEIVGEALAEEVSL